MTEEQAAEFLKTLKPGYLPKSIFDEIARIWVIPTLEIIPLRLSPETNKVQVLLTQRPQDDNWWPDEWHNPGSVILATDPMNGPHDYLAAAERVFGEKGELKGSIKVVNGPVEFETERRSTNRGHEISIICFAEVEGEPVEGKFFDIDNLPEKRMLHQTRTIELAAQEFTKAKGLQ
jgi:hypothetical protein